MKKLFAFLLIMLATAGSFFPCCLQDNCCTQPVASTSNNDATHGICSPLSACAACPAPAELAKAIELPVPFDQQTLHSESGFSFQLSSYTPSFWQPPRIA